MGRRHAIWHVSNAFHYAGTERAMSAWCLGLDPRRFEVSAYSRLDAGPRLKPLKARLKDAAVMGGEASAWRALFKRKACDLLHVHRHGAADSGWDAVIAAGRAAGVKVTVETNVFGAHDDTGLGNTLDHHFFVSAMCLWRYAGWPHALPSGYFEKHSVLYNPLSRSEIPYAGVSARWRLDARKRLGIPGDAFVLGRLGRPDMNKWPAWLPKAFAALAASRPPAHLLLMAAPPEAVAELNSLGLRGRYTALDASGDWERVSLAYQAMDCLAHGSRVGESFGYTLAEAAAFGLPVVVDSTPWADNAQVEVVDHAETGLVAGRPGSWVAALEALCDDPGLRARLGAEGKKRAWKRFDSRALTRELEGRYLALLKGARPAEQAWVREFRAGYGARLEARVDASWLKDGAWGLVSSLKLYWRGWISRGLRSVGLRN